MMDIKVEDAIEKSCIYDKVNFVDIMSYRCIINENDQ